ncbi:hypothetical protein LY71_109176 [Geodermatophilus tzadiensis]|uniref:Uncharacterized protein n=1 Tax=Geodermatophilus tzadiensis TaxID=1137988 RepID=A0A2T0TSA8_9ACTN|nr:hypothetical protein LY71_109176 [Geodermatophilus tzadiensis]
MQTGGHGQASVWFRSLLPRRSGTSGGLRPLAGPLHWGGERMSIFQPWLSSGETAVLIAGPWFLACYSAARNAVKHRPSGYGRLTAPYVWLACIAAPTLTTTVAIYGLMSDPTAIAGYIYLAPLAATIRGLRDARRERWTPSPQAGRGWLGSYLKIAFALFGWHVVLLILHRAAYMDSQPFVLPALSDQRYGEHLTLLIAFFVLSQASTSLAARALLRALQSDWRDDDGRPIARSRQYGLAILPIFACLGPSLFAHALFIGILWRLAHLASRWMRGLPIAPEVSFVEGLTRRVRRA